MPRSNSLTAEDVVFLLQSGDRPVWTAGEVADEFDVAKNTARDRLKRITSRPGVKTGQVGQATVYWYDMDAAIKDRDLNLEDAVAEYRTAAYEDLLLSRAKWQYAYDRLQSDLGSGDPSPVRQRHWGWIVIKDYIRSISLHCGVDVGSAYGQEYSDSSGDRGDEDLIDTSGSNMSRERAEYFVYDAPMYQNEECGHVEGLIGLMQVTAKIREAASDEDGNVSTDLVSDEELKSLLPNHSELLGIGATVDRFATEWLGWQW